MAKKKAYKDMTPEEKFQHRITWHDDDIVILGKPTVTETDVTSEALADDDEPVAAYKTPKR